MKKILFFHNTLMSYRTPFFLRLNKIYELNLIFKNSELSHEKYNVNLSPEISKISDINYSILEKPFKFFKIIKELFKRDYDIVVDSLDASCIVTFITAKMIRKPIILWSEEWGWKDNSLKRKISLDVTKVIAKYSNGLIVPGSNHKEYFQSLGVSTNKIFIVPNVSDMVNEGMDGKIGNKMEITDKKVVLYVGRLLKRKGVEYLLKAFAEVKNEFGDVVLVIIGDGVHAKELKLLAENLGISDSVFFVGQVENEKLPNYYDLCNICVVPSINHKMKDPWVFVVNEAMYFSKPVVVTDAVGAAFDMVKNGINGYIVPEKNVNELFKALKNILSDQELELKMGKESKRIIENNFRYENMAKGFKEAISHVVDGE